MSRSGSTLGFLHGLHHKTCEKPQPQIWMQPVVVPEGDEPGYYDHNRGAEIVVVFMGYCPDCGAAEYEVI